MKNNILLVPTAKLQIGNKGSISFDTTSTNGKKSFQITLISDNDTITKEIENVVEEIKTEVSTELKNEFDDSKNEHFNTMIEMNRHEPMTKLANFSIPLFFMLILFSYLAFRSYQNRKWKEALLNKGMNADEINKLVTTENLLIEKLKENDLEGYEKRKHLKYALVFGSFGLSILLGNILDDAGYFFGFLFVFLGLSFWFYNNKTK